MLKKIIPLLFLLGCSAPELINTTEVADVPVETIVSNLRTCETHPEIQIGRKDFVQSMEVMSCWYEWKGEEYNSCKALLKLREDIEYFCKWHGYTTGREYFASDAFCDTGEGTPAPIVKTIVCSKP
jgi:hypothetical protein